MAIDSNDQQVTSEMSRRFENCSINDQECDDAYESAPVGDYWPCEPTLLPEFDFDPTSEPNAKFGLYTPGPTDESRVFDPVFMIRDTTDIGSEGSSVYPGPTPKIGLNGMDWGFVEFTHLSTENGIGYNATDSSPVTQQAYSLCPSNERVEQFPSTASQNVAVRCPHGCPKTFRRQYDLGRHIKEQHQCPHQYCGEKLFSTPAVRKHHLQNEHHENDFLYKCGSCGLNGHSSRAFTRKEKLKKHFKVSHGITTEPQWGAFQCLEDPCYVEEFCGGTWFLSQDELNRHFHSEHAERSSEGSQPTVSETTPPNSKALAAAQIHSFLQASSSAGIIGKRLLGKASESDPKRCKSEGADVASPALRFNALPQSGLHTVSLGSSDNTVEKQAKANGSSPIHSEPSINPGLISTTQFEVTHSIRVIELHALVNRDDFDHIVKQLESFRLSPVFDTSKEAIKLRGTCSTVDMEKGEKLLKGLIDQVKLEDPPKRKADVSIRKMLRRKFSPQVPPAAPVKISALDPVEDEEALTTWANFVLPQLPKAVDDLPIGEKYSAALVRQEGSDGTPIPIIRFRSSNGQSEATRKTIRTKIENLCKQNGRPVLPVQFSKGITVPLVGNEKRSMDCLVADDDPPNDKKRFPHQRRHWQKVGMGASIGMRECAHISATSGGYILINEQKYMLSVDHFIQEAMECDTCNTGITGNTYEASTKINSPSPGDVDELSQDLDSKLIELELKVRDSAPQEEIPLGRAREMLLPEEISEELKQFERFRQDLRKDAKEYELGEVVYRCVQDSFRESTWHQPTAASTLLHRMDWSISKVRKLREGKNVHRHGRVTELGMDNFKAEIVKPEGAGEPCEETGEPQGGDKVHYVGQTSGLRFGIINPALQLVKDEQGNISQEWAIVVSDSDKEGSEFFAGDSGAWIIRNDKKLVGLLWGWDNFLLLFTPVRDVFADIERVLGGSKKICLPPHSRSSRIMLQTTQRISRKHNSRLRIASGYVGPRLEEQLLTTQQAKAKPHSLITADLSANTQSEISTDTENDQISNLPLSPVPSLVSSTSSCSSPTASSPRPRSPSEPSIIEFEPVIRQELGKLEELHQMELPQYPKFGKVLKRSLSFEHLKKIGQQGLVKHFPTWTCGEEFGYMFRGF